MPAIGLPSRCLSRSAPQPYTLNQLVELGPIGRFVSTPSVIRAAARQPHGFSSVTITALRPEAQARGARMLRTALGPAIAGWLDDASVGEVMLNPDGRLWIDRLAGGLEDTGLELAAADGERIIRLVAHHVGAEVHPGNPRVWAELPGTGERFEGLSPPVRDEHFDAPPLFFARVKTQSLV